MNNMTDEEKRRVSREIMKSVGDFPIREVISAAEELRNLYWQEARRIQGMTSVMEIKRLWKDEEKEWKNGNSLN